MSDGFLTGLCIGFWLGMLALVVIVALCDLSAGPAYRPAFDGLFLPPRG